MNVIDGTELFLNRRAHSRVPYHASIRLAPDPAFPLRLHRAITQDVGLGGVQILSPAILERERPFDVWLPTETYDVLHAKAHVVWYEIEDTLGDSPYWIRSGLHFSFANLVDRKKLADFVASKSDVDRVRKEQEVSKVGYVF